MRLKRPSHATVVAYLALFVALGGSAYAVSKVGTSDLRRGAVTSAKVRDHTLRASDLRKLRLRTATRNVPAGETVPQTVVARCRRGEVLISGGGGWISDGSISSSSPGRDRVRGPVVNFEVLGENTDGDADTLVAEALCLRR